MNIFYTAFIQVFLVAVNTIFLSKGIVFGIAIFSFLISWFWVSNVKKMSISSKKDRYIYCFGAMLGGVVGFLFTQFFT